MELALNVTGYVLGIAGALIMWATSFPPGPDAIETGGSRLPDAHPARRAALRARFLLKTGILMVAAAFALQLAARIASGL